MAYQVLARRWRPQRFDEVVGQDHVTRTLSNAIRTERLAHAFLFCGPRGVGKTTTARILAKCLNCERAEDGPVVDPCNECVACREISDGSSLDVLEIDGASNRGIDEIRGLRENVRYAPSAGRSKVYIIDEVHMLTKEAFNALLKTLEEPPPSVYFVFATTEIHKVPSTIRSRCQKYDFHRISATQIEKTLARLAEKEKIEISPTALAELARQADGGLRDAESLLDQAAAVGDGAVELETLYHLLGEVEDRVYLALVESIAKSDPGAAYSRLSELLDRGMDPERVAVALTQTLRDLLVVRTAPDESGPLGVRADLVDDYRAVGQALSPGRLTSFLSIASRTVSELRRSPRPRLSLEVALARMCRVEDPGELAALLSRVEALQAALGSAPAPAPAPTPTPTGPSGKAPSRPAPAAPATHAEEDTGSPPEAPAPPEGLECSDETAQVWGELLGRVRGRKRMLASFLEHGAPTGLTDDSLQLVFDNNYYEGMVRRHENRELIEAELSDIAGKKLTMDVRLGEIPGAARRAAEGAPPKTEKKGDLLAKNPGLGRVMKDLGGQLLPGGGL